MRCLLLQQIVPFPLVPAQGRLAKIYLIFASRFTDEMQLPFAWTNNYGYARMPAYHVGRKDLIKA